MRLPYRIIVLLHRYHINFNIYYTDGTKLSHISYGGSQESNHTFTTPIWNFGITAFCFIIVPNIMEDSCQHTPSQDPELCMSMQNGRLPLAISDQMSCSYHKMHSRQWWDGPDACCVKAPRMAVFFCAPHLSWFWLFYYLHTCFFFFFFLPKFPYCTRFRMTETHYWASLTDHSLGASPLDALLTWDASCPVLPSRRRGVTQGTPL